MNNPQITLPAVRIEQLRIISQEVDCSPAELLDQYIQGAWEWSGYELDLPLFDFSVSRDDDTGEPRVFFVAPGAQILDFSIKQTQAVARGITALLDGTASDFVIGAQCGGDPGCLIGESRDRSFVLKIAGDLDGASSPAVVALTRSVAADLAKIFKDRVAKAQAMAA